MEKNWENRDEFFKNGCPFCETHNFIFGLPGVSITCKCTFCGAKFDDKGPLEGVDLVSLPDNPEVYKDLVGDVEIKSLDKVMLFDIIRTYKRIIHHYDETPNRSIFNNKDIEKIKKELDWLKQRQDLIGD